jgi:hypothetical protein
MNTDTNIKELDTDVETNLDELIAELEAESDGVEICEKPKKPSFIQTLITSWSCRKHYPMRDRFQKLAGINKVLPVAQLTIGDKTIPMDKVSPWYDIIRYKLCGFSYEIFKK